MAPERLTGVLLVGGASSRFGSPKALARLGHATLAERGWRTLAETCDDRLAVGKAGELDLPFAVVDDGSPVRAPIAGLVAALAAAPHDLCVVLPVDCPLVTLDLLSALAAACEGVDAAVPQTGPLPGAYRKSALPVLRRRLAAGRLSLRDALSELSTRTVDLDAVLLANVNTPDDLRLIERQ